MRSTRLTCRLRALRTLASKSLGHFKQTGLVALFSVNLAEHRLSTLMPAYILQQHIKRTFWLSHRGDMRGQQDLRVVPERMLGPRRFFP